ncbi:MAG TPA: Spy/CpxP family protein refolding chaperone [Paucimonas sp.]|nr:Spy/CpxP family protein refolding chaperone [Paucimonas sp.]
MKIRNIFTRPAGRLLMATGILLSASQAAQAMEHPPGPRMGHHGGHGPRGMPGPMGAAGHMPPYLRGIDLTEAQRDKIFDILHSQAPQMRDRAKAVGKARKDLHALAMSSDYDEAKAKSLADALSRATAEMTLMRVRADRQIYALLTPEQRKRIDERKKRAEPGAHPARP